MFGMLKWWLIDSQRAPPEVAMLIGIYLSLVRRSLYFNILISDFNYEESNFLLILSKTIERLPCI
jgi:hypothetical protein